jgi:hypothetical protein
MTCEEAKRILPDYWSQALDGEQELRMEEHLGTCAGCRAEADRLAVLWRDLALIPAEEPGAAVRTRFYESLRAYRQGMDGGSQPGRNRWQRVLAGLVPRRPVWQAAFAAVCLIAGLAVGYRMNAEKGGSEISQLREEVDSMRQLVVLSLLQQQSASERLRGVSWSQQVPPSDNQVLSALLDSVRNDPNVNVRLAAVDALRAFGGNAAARTGIVQAMNAQSAPLVQVALIDLAVDLKERTALDQVRKLAENEAADPGVRERANWALERLQ